MTDGDPVYLGPSAAGPGAPLERPLAGRTTRAATSRAAAPTVTVAGFWRRAVAAAIDLAVIAPVGLILTWITCLVLGLALPVGKTGELDFWLDQALTSDPAVMAAGVVVLAVASLYLFVFQAILAQTLGMRALGLRVIDVYGEPPSYPRAGLRTLGYLASTATLFLGFFWIGFDAEKRGLHDWIAGTYVIRS